MASADYSSRAIRRPESFGELVAKINSAPSGPAKDTAYLHAEEFDKLETQARIVSLKGRHYGKDISYSI